MERKKAILLIARILASAAILLFIIRMVDFSNLYSQFLSINYTYVTYALFITLFIRIIMALRWSFYVSAQNYEISTFWLLKTIVMSHTLGILIPSSMGVDGVRAYFLAKYTGKAIDSVSSVVSDRCAGLISLFIISSFVSLVSANYLGTLKYVFINISILTCFIISLFFFPILIRKIFVYLSKKDKIKNNRIVKILEDLSLSILKLWENKKLFVSVMLLSLSGQFLRILLVFCLSASVNIDVSFVYFVLFMPLIMLLLMMPISIGGVGVQELVFIQFFGKVGMTVEQAVSLSILSYADDLFWVLAGTLTYMIKGIGRNGLSTKL